MSEYEKIVNKLGKYYDPIANEIYDFKEEYSDSKELFYPELEDGTVCQCEECNGNGKARKKLAKCKQCNGTGEYGSGLFTSKECEKCDGSGIAYVSSGKCEECKGTGYLFIVKKFRD